MEPAMDRLLGFLDRLAASPHAAPCRVVWRLVSQWADRARARDVPRPGLVPHGPSPLAAEACLDPRTLAEPERFYAAPPAARPATQATVDERAGVAVEALTFESPAPFGIARNDLAHLRVYAPTLRPSSFSLLLLHGVWRQDRDFEDWMGRALAQHGVTAAVLSLPFHWERGADGVPSGAQFFSADPLWTAAAFRQAAIDARAALGWLRGSGRPVGLVGFSLGGILAHVVMSLEPLDLAVSVLAGGNTAGVVWEGTLTRAYRLAMQAGGITLGRLTGLWSVGNPSRYAARVRARRILMVNARYDQVVPRRFTDELWQALGKPAIRWLAAGHITAFLFRRVIVDEILRATGLPGRVPARPRTPVLAPARAGAR
jgi:dienelactone hydrolase